MRLRCYFGFHALIGRASQPGIFGGRRCRDCAAVIGGIPIEGPGPEPRYDGLLPNRFATKRADGRSWRKLRLVR